MTAIGGFFELELIVTGTSYHQGALALCSGRACLRAILEVAKPRCVLVPFFICNSALVPFNTLGIPYIFYGLTPALEPQLSETHGPDVCLMYVNYFGLKTASAAALAGSRTAKVIIDDSQAFYERGYDTAWSFNSARKFFGVPDGAFAYGPGLAGKTPAARLDVTRYDHLMNRLLGRLDLAYQQYVESEKHVSADVLGPSILAERLLAGIDYSRAYHSRRRNFALMHERLRGLNRLQIDLESIDGAVPFCYPFLPGKVISFESLWRREIFVPRLWPDVNERGGDGFEWDRQIAARLLPLPIDHRYGAAEMNRVCDAIFEEIG